MAIAPAISAQISEDLARLTETAGQAVVALQGKEGHTASAVLWRPEVVVTANHSARYEEATVLFAEGKSAVARIKGRDLSTDLAIFKVEGDQKNVAALGDAGDLRVGHLVMALARTRRGNLTASAGIISGLMGGWQTWQGGQIDRFIRPDLTLYRGYSGGPLINTKGEVVGINTTGLRRGTPIAIPSSTVSRVVEELLSKGHIARPYLGVALQPVALPENMTARFNIASRYGLLIVHVEGDGPAGKAGLMLGDTLVEIEGKPVAQLARAHSLLGNQKVGDSVVLGILRSGEQKQITVALGDRLGQ